MRNATRMATVVAAATLILGGAVASGTHAQEGARPAAPLPRTNAPGVVVQTQFVPIAPCRIANTKNSTAGILNAKKARVLRVTGTAGFPKQGGKNGGCGIPAGAAAVVVSLTTANSAKAGRLTVFANGSKKPNAFSLSYTTASISNEVTARLGTNGRIKVFPTTATNLIADVVGYYAEPIAAYVGPSGALLFGSPQVTGASRTAAGIYLVFINTPIKNCVAIATARSSIANVGAYTDLFSDRVEIYITNQADSSYIDASFYLTVTC